MSKPATDTASLDANPIMALHREPDGYIGFVRKPAKPIFGKDGKPIQFENLCSIQASELKSMFPAIAEWLTSDSYFTVNAYYRPAPWKSKITGLPGVWREEKHLTRLTSCYADVDCGREESAEPNERMQWTQALAECESLMDADELPQASIIARSGRGLYLFWLLRDEREPDRLPTAHAWQLPTYKAVNKALHKRLMARHLPIDTKAHDAARVLRTPGSINSKSKRRVHYWIRADAKGKGFMYTLPELAKSLGIASPGASLPGSMEALAEKPQYRKVKRPGTAPARKAGKLKLNAQRASDLLTIQAWRGGFLKRGAKYDNNGHTSHGRAAHLKLYANFLRGAGMDKGEALNKLREMAANMKPAYPSDSPQDDPPVESLLENEYTSVKSRRWANKTLCPLLGIDSDIAQVLELKTIKPDEMHKQEHDERPTQKEIADERREWLRQYTIANMAPPGGWTGKLALNAYKAFAPQHLADTINNSVTAHTDLNTIGIKTHKPGRRRKQPTE